DFGSADCDITKGVDPLRHDNAALLDWHRDADDSLPVYRWTHDRLHRDDRDIPGRNQGRPLIPFALLQRHNRQRSLWDKTWPFIAVDKAAFDHAALNEPVLDRRRNIGLLHGEPRRDGWALQNRSLILEIGREIRGYSDRCAHQS
ncbi:hypothetical protein, partial [Microvirga zambiensis]|uniref:hypothetical protein n=1 Tax=Microvirga zambiensis TaxID=1402137 RepID=UPI00191FA57C